MLRQPVDQSLRGVDSASHQRVVDDGTSRWRRLGLQVGIEVSLVTIDQGGHILYPAAGTDIDTARLAWDLMRQFGNGS